jgi:hypothetical protein
LRLSFSFEGHWNLTSKATKEASRSPTRQYALPQISYEY